MSKFVYEENPQVTFWKEKVEKLEEEKPDSGAEAGAGIGEGGIPTSDADEDDEDGKKKSWWQRFKAWLKRLCGGKKKEEAEETEEEPVTVGASRSAAKLPPKEGVISKSFARIHAANLINAGILPLTFADSTDYEKITQDSQLRVCGLMNGMQTGKLIVEDISTGRQFAALCDLSDRQMQILRAGGLLNYTKEGGQ